MVAVAHSAELAMPKRCSLSCRLPPVLPSVALISIPASRSAGEPCCSAGYATTTPAMNIASIAE